MYKDINSRFFTDRVSEWLLQHMLFKYFQSENSVYILKMFCQTARSRFYWSIECTLYKKSAFDIDSYLLDSFYTQFVNSSLFVKAILFCCLIYTNITTTIIYL
jgi:hypothetical protein